MPPAPRKRFGQHFLESAEIVQNIVGAIAARAGDIVVEIGPGRGAITGPLAGSGATLHAIEFDRDLVPWLRQRYRSLGNVFIHEADALSFDYASLGNKLRIVGNLPYNISTPLLFRMTEYASAIGDPRDLRDLHFMLQKEVVDRITALPGTGEYGRLTIMLGCRLHAEQLFDVPASAFRPPPRVTSSFIRLWPRQPDEMAIADPKLMSRIVAQAFSQRRKTLRNALKGTATSEDLDTVHIDPGARAEEVPVTAWVALANHLAPVKKDRMPQKRRKT
jgi:16S rRNA (adenine1518-N6/adenine1519-N6)-dimethyltransferase